MEEQEYSVWPEVTDRGEGGGMYEGFSAGGSQAQSGRLEVSAWIPLVNYPVILPGRWAEELSSTRGHQASANCT